MADNSIYIRTISQQEAREGYFMVLKDRLAFFPLVGSPFELQVGGQRRKAVVEQYHCECRGPDEPHNHYLVRQAGLKKGDTIVLRKDVRKSGRYVLSVRSLVAGKELCG